MITEMLWYFLPFWQCALERVCHFNFFSNWLQILFNDCILYVCCCISL